MADAPDSSLPDTTPPAERGAAQRQPAKGTLDDARLELRSVGYCVLCDALVERSADGSCPADHPPAAISGRMLLVEGEDVPSLPKFNVAAFLVPFLWGPAHGQWVGAVFLPIWLFMDSIVVSAVHGGLGTRVVAVVVVALTVAFEYYFARRANGVAYRRVMDRMSVDEFARRQRVWAVAAVPIAVVLVSWAVWFDVAVRPTLSR